MVSESVRNEFREQGRGIVGALLVVGLTFLYTMETWWLGWTLPLGHLLAYALVGLAIVLVVARNVGFRREEREESKTSLPGLAVEYTEILVQSSVAAVVGLFTLGIATLGDSPSVVLRLGLLEVVPLGFGAALANRLFVHTGAAEEEVQFPRNLAIFTLGALFVSGTIAPTREIELIAAHMGWGRHALLVVLTLFVVYVTLYELSFRGQPGRAYEKRRYEIGTAFLAFAVSTGVATFLLWGYGHFDGATLALVVQETTVLAFPAAVGAVGAQVVL